jgi:integration host factor subunit alpha
MTLTKDMLVDVLRDKTKYSLQETKKLVEIILETIKSTLEEGQEVKISGFGKWQVREKNSRPGRNPHTGGKIEIAARKVVSFHASEKLREVVAAAPLSDDQVTMVRRSSKGDVDEDD